MIVRKSQQQRAAAGRAPSLAPREPSQKSAQPKHIPGGPAQAALGYEAVHARQRRLLAFVDSCESRVEELLNETVADGGDTADLIALLSDGTVLPHYINLVPRSAGRPPSREAAAPGLRASAP